MCRTGDALEAVLPQHRPGAIQSLNAAQIRAALAVPALARTAHFSLQHLTPQPPAGALVRDLSTAGAPIRDGFVDNVPVPTTAAIGFAVPKRHARRAVTRNLIRRQMRQYCHSRGLAAGAWLLRLRAGFDPRLFRSAGSAALRAAVRAELELLFARAGLP